MTLRLYDSLTRCIRDFQPIKTGEVSMYVCGATVQSVPHLGHIRSAISFDILRRWLLWQNYDVFFIRNITDIDDKILAKATEAGRPWWEWASTHERAFDRVYDALGILPPSAQPRATGYMLSIIECITELISRGHAYPCGGDVYFDVLSFPEYGALSGHRIDEVQQGESATDHKRDSRDFTLWKSAKPSEPSWNSPWGPGRPGWHIECSAMSRTLLGSHFDIHGGGIDLMFPHHENEIAQSRCLGDAFANFWLHNGWITASGEKMSKSLGNYIQVDDLLSNYRHCELRYYLGSTHYRSHQEFSLTALSESAKAYRRIENLLMRCEEKYGEISIGTPTNGFINALNNDIAVPEALAEIHVYTNKANQLLATDHPDVKDSVEQIRAMMHILGCDPLDAHWRGTSNTDVRDYALDALIGQALTLRRQAREEHDYALADKIRADLAGLGIVITDTPQGSSWSLDDSFNSDKIYVKGTHSDRKKTRSSS